MDKQLEIKNWIKKTKYGYNFDSFDRFGDDLCQLLLSYLSISDKIRLQTVSKQWKSLIFNKHKSLEIQFNPYYSKVDEIHCFRNKLFFNRSSDTIINNKFDNLFKRFEFTQYLVFNYDMNYGLIAISNYFQHLIGLKLNYKKPIDRIDRNLSVFKPYFGQRLKSLDIRGIETENVRQLLRLNKNLEEVKCEGINVFIDSDEYHLNKLLNICVKKVLDLNDIKLFADKYCNQINKIEIFLYSQNLINDEINRALEELSRFERLETLKLIINSRNSCFETGLTSIALKCNQLKNFSIDCYYHNFNGNYFKIFGKCMALESLSIFEIKDNYSLNREIKSLKTCKNLKSLSLYNINEKILTDIPLYSPNLTQLYLYDSQLTDKCFDYFKELKKLSLLSFHFIELSIDLFNDEIIIDLLENFENLCVIDLYSIKSSLSETTINAFIERANNNQKIEYKLSFPRIENVIKSMTNCNTICKNLTIHGKRY